MRQLVVEDRIINKDLLDILFDVQRECHTGKLSNFRLSGSGISVPCPHHSDGKEHHNSCYINIENDDVEYGLCHCFTCGFVASFPKFVGECFNRGEKFGADWLIANYANDYVKQDLILPKIDLDESNSSYLDESILDKFESYHPYMTQRKLSKEVIEQFKIKYDPVSQCIVFPVRDRYGKLKFLTRRSVFGKYFFIDGNADKKNIFGLSEVIKGDYRECVVCESQINALTAWSYGYPAIALLGAGTTKEQMNELNNTSIRHWILAYDPDEAGDKGANRFIKLVKRGVFVDKINFPSGRDLNDLSKEEFEVSLQNASRII